MILLVSNKIWHYYYFAIAAGTPGEELTSQTKKKFQGMSENSIIAKHKGKRWEIKTINHDNDGIETKEGTLL